MDNPTNYYLFYEYFLSAAVGEEEWKQNSGYQHHMRKRARRQSYTTNIISPEPMTRDRLSIVKDKRMAMSLNEAFALILFKNNYFAWLLEAKQNNSDLVCDYDVNISGKKTLVEFLLNGSIVELDVENEATDYIIWKTVVGTPEYCVA